jgi:hypothetical protein
MSLIILRLHPVESVTPADFELSLAGLRIIVRDLAFRNLMPVTVKVGLASIAQELFTLNFVVERGINERGGPQVLAV